MKINEIIRQKRTEKGYTQEQIASFLGVSAPAVNKWEKAISYPDITLLPALARLLGTDLNTLLSFQDDLTKEEIGIFINELVSIADTEGIDAAFHMAQDKLHEYPTCDLLLLNTALTLEGLIIMSKTTVQNCRYAADIEEMYTRASKSCDPAVSSHAKAMLISKHRKRKEFDAARRLLNELPDTTLYNKKQLEATLCQEEGNLEQAAQIIEGKILSEISGVQSALFTLVEIAVKEHHLSEAEQLTEIAKETGRLFDLWDCNSHIADFQLAVAQRDTGECLHALEKMLPGLCQEWKPDHSPLYRHLSMKGTNMGSRMLSGILNELEDTENHEYDFLREDTRIQNLLDQYHSAVKMP